VLLVFLMPPETCRTNTITPEAHGAPTAFFSAARVRGKGRGLGEALGRGTSGDLEASGEEDRRPEGGVLAAVVG
jgi:hypothetical protein